MRMDLEQSIVKTSEYSSFSSRYPYITESIRLEREIKRLTNKLKTEKVRSTKFKIKRKISITQTKLRKNNLLKRIHRENKQEAIFQRKLKHDNTKMRISALTKKGSTALGQISRRLRRSMHKNLPPTLFSLRELDASEKGLALREWIQEKRKKTR
jgi:hypothetical protein